MSNTTEQRTTRGERNSESTKLLTKLAKAANHAAALKIVERAGDPTEVLTKLAESGQLTLTSGEGIVRLFVNWVHFLPAEAVVAWLEALPSASSPEAYMECLPGLAWPVRYAVRTSSKGAPDVWRSALASASGRKRDAIMLGLGDLGELAPEVDRARLLEELVELAFTDSCDDPTGTAAALGVTGRAWGERILTPFLKHSPANPWAFPDVLALVPFAMLERMVLESRPCIWNTERTVLNVLRARDDDSASLVALANSLASDPRTDDVYERDKLLEAIAALALERAHAAGTDAPSGLETYLNGSHSEHAWRNERVAPFASALPRGRLFDLLERQLEDFSFSVRSPGSTRESGHLFAALLRTHFDEPFARRWIARTCEALAKGCEVQKREGVSLGQAGPRLLPLVLETLAQQSNPSVRLGLRLAVLHIAVEMARSEVAIPDVVDAAICGDAEARDFARELAAAALLGPVLAKLPSDRAERVVRSWLATESSSAVKELVTAVPEHLRNLVVEETPGERITRLAAATGLACDTRIYALLPVPWDPDKDNGDIVREVGPVNWAGVAPKGLRAERIPKVKNKAMKHVLTFDLNDMPELRARFDLPEARAVALFVSPQKNNDAGECFNDDMEYVPLSEEEALSGPRGEDGSAFVVHALDVPGRVFSEDGSPALDALRRAIGMLPGRALGAPSLIQHDDKDALDAIVGQFAMQLDQRIVNMNLGDEGRLYLYKTTAFFQSH